MLLQQQLVSLYCNLERFEAWEKSSNIASNLYLLSDARNAAREAAGKPQFYLAKVSPCNPLTPMQNARWHTNEQANQHPRRPVNILPLHDTRAMHTL